jgi:hypothetical protein
MSVQATCCRLTVGAIVGIVAGSICTVASTSLSSALERLWTMPPIFSVSFPLTMNQPCQLICYSSRLCLGTQVKTVTPCVVVGLSLSRGTYVCSEHNTATFKQSRVRKARPGRLDSHTSHQTVQLEKLTHKARANDMLSTRTQG